MITRETSRRFIVVDEADQPGGSAAPKEMQLLAQVTCPFCWRKFPPEATLWVAEHPDLAYDPVLGPNVPERFFPSRFDAEGCALDLFGTPCRGVACPRCRTRLPRILFEHEPLPIAFVGAAGSGKTFLLHSMIHTAKTTLRDVFRIGLVEPDENWNHRWLREENSLFEVMDAIMTSGIAPDAVPRIAPGKLVDPTSAIGVGRDPVPPRLVVLEPLEGHTRWQHAESVSRTLWYFDVSGEDYEPPASLEWDDDVSQGASAKSALEPPAESEAITRFLARSAALFFCFDPTQHEVTRKRCKSALVPHSIGSSRALSEQHRLLRHTAKRIRRYTGMSSSVKDPRPLFVLITKCDLWAEGAKLDLPTAPWQLGNDRERSLRLMMEPVQQTSAKLRRWLSHDYPDFVEQVDKFASEVYFMPVSAFGPNLKIEQQTQTGRIRMDRIQPMWVTLPLFLAVARLVSGSIGIIKAPKTRQPEEEEEVS